MPAATVKNQMAGHTYDAAGNLWMWGFTYDAENRLISTPLANLTYDYDADGRRAKKTDGTTGTLYWYGTGGEVLQETDLAGVLKREFVYFNGTRTARRDAPSGNVHYYFSDHLGSSNVVTCADGTIKEESDFYPFGGERVVTNLLPDQDYKFTGKERDPETNLDYFGARYYSFNFGRFITPDWADKPTAVPYADFGNPQSLNLYSYVGNNPMAKVDKDGHCGPACPLIPSLIAGGLTWFGFEGGEAYYHGKEFDALKESYKAQTKMLELYTDNPMGAAQSRIDVDALKNSIQATKLQLFQQGYQVGSDVNSLLGSVNKGGGSSNPSQAKVDKIVGTAAGQAKQEVGTFLKLSEAVDNGATNQGNAQSGQQVPGTEPPSPPQPPPPPPPPQSNDEQKP